MDIALKQRLVGVMVLISLAIIFLPSLFHRDQRVAVDTTTLIPVKPKVETVVIEAPVKPKGIAPAPSPAKAFQPPVEEAKASTPVTKPKLKSKPSTNKLVLNEKGLPDAWVVQLGSFQSQKRADDLKAQLLKSDYKAYTRAVKTAKGQFFRVFVGPYVDKSRAAKIKSTLDKAYQVKSQILTFAPE